MAAIPRWLFPGELARLCGPRRCSCTGFWQAEWDRLHAGPLAAGLAGAGFTVCVLEFRRVGTGGGWPATSTDIARAMDVLPGRPGGLLGIRQFQA